jgi:hypothetical protein
MTFRPIYLGIAAVLFVVEVAIARGAIPGAFVRNSLGDVLVIPLLYCLLRGLTRASPSVALAICLAMGLVAEVLQYLRLAELLGLQHGGASEIVLGTTFSYADLLMYCIGGVLGVWVDVWALRNRRAPQQEPPAPR